MAQSAKKRSGGKVRSTSSSKKWGAILMRNHEILKKLSDEG